MAPEGSSWRIDVEARYARLTDLMELAGLLQSRLTGMSLDQIAERFDVSRRTAERMLAALRDRFPEIEAELRDGHKYWHLPRTSRSVAPGVPVELEHLARRVAELESDLADRASASEQLRAISEDVLGNSAVGIFVLDAGLRVAWMNPAAERYLGIRACEVVGRDMRELVRERISRVFADPSEFERRVLASYQDGSYIEMLGCRVTAGERGAEHWLEHWSQPIPTGPYAGGRIEHFVDVSSLVNGGLGPGGPLPAITACALRSFRDPLSLLEAEAESAVSNGEDPSAALVRISKLARSIRRSADLSLRLAISDAADAEHTPVPEVLEAAKRAVAGAAEAGGILVEVDDESGPCEVLVDRLQLIAALTELACEIIDQAPRGARIRLGAERLGGGIIRFVVASPSVACGAPFLQLPCCHRGTAHT